MTQATAGGAAGRLFQALTPLRAAALALIVAFATIAGAWGFEAAGYAPCELCLQQRWAYYAGVPLAAFATASFAAGWRKSGAAALAVFAAIFLAGAAFGAWHAGVEWGFWPGPAGCTGASFARAGDMSDFLQQIQQTKVVRCDEVAIRIFGLSLAGWNAVISLGLVAVAAIGVRRALA